MYKRQVEGKIVIWAHWQRDVNRIIREIVKKYGENSFVDYYGPTPMSERQENIRKFQDPDSPVRFFVGTTQTGGYGITLTAASTMVYYSNGYDLTSRCQWAHITILPSTSSNTFISSNNLFESKSFIVPSSAVK